MSRLSADDIWDQLCDEVKAVATPPEDDTPPFDFVGGRDTNARSNTTGAVLTWLTPADLWAPLAPVAELPTALLPHTLDQFARSLPRVFSPAALGAAALAVCSIAASHRVRISINPTWIEPFLLWVGLYGASSSAKSPTIKAAMRPLNAAQAKILEEHQAALKTWERQREAAKKSGEAFDDPQPTLTRYVTQNATIEAVSELLKDNDHGIGFVHDELSALIAAMEGPYRERGASSRGDWLALYDGGVHSVDRIQRGTVFIKNFAATFLGGITTDKLSRTIRESAADGLLSRLSFVQVPSLPPSDELDAIDLQTYRCYEALVTRLLNNRPPREMLVPLASGAREILGAAKKRWQTEAEAYAERLPRYAERLGKLVGVAARTALGFAIIEEAENPGGAGPTFREFNPPEGVTSDQMDRACRYVDYQARHDFALYWQAIGEGDVPVVTAAKTVASFILHSGVTEFQLGEVTRRAREWRHIRSAEQFAGLSLLDQLAWIRPTIDPPYVGGQFIRGTVWLVNPRVHERYRDRAEALKRVAAQVRERILEDSRAQAERGNGHHE